MYHFTFDSMLQKFYRIHNNTLFIEKIKIVKFRYSATNLTDSLAQGQHPFDIGGLPSTFRSITWVVCVEWIDNKLLNRGFYRTKRKTMTQRHIFVYFTDINLHINFKDAIIQDWKCTDNVILWRVSVTFRTTWLS